jgi:UDP-N-acetylmuramate dehydrogenase
MQHKLNLKPFNTFGIAAQAQHFASFQEVQQLPTLLASYPNLPLLILGGGSNILFTDDFQGLVLRNEIKGIELVNEDAENVYVKSGAGEVWHEFVCHCIDHNWAGIENLSLITGSVGASPMAWKSKMYFTN